jgi:hypothetical protein
MGNLIVRERLCANVIDDNPVHFEKTIDLPTHHEETTKTKTGSLEIFVV